MYGWGWKLLTDFWLVLSPAKIQVPIFGPDI